MRIKIISLLFIALFFTNCSTKKLSPSNVTDYFWVAQQESKLEDAKKFVRDDDKQNVALQKFITIKYFTFSDAIVDGDTATVPTRMYLESILSKKEKDQVMVNFNTALEKTEDGWKVNLVETKKNLYIETAKMFYSGFGVGLFNKMQESLGDLQGLQDIFKEMVEGMKKSLEKK